LPAGPSGGQAAAGSLRQFRACAQLARAVRVAGSAWPARLRQGPPISRWPHWGRRLSWLSPT